MSQEKIFKIIADSSSALESWIVEDKGSFKMLDFSETAYSENYSSGNSAVVFAYLYRKTGDKKYLELCERMLKRAMECCSDSSFPLFTKVFIANYSMVAIAVLYNGEPEKIPEEYKEYFKNFEDPLTQMNVNCAALQLSMELLNHSLGIRSLKDDYCVMLLDFIKSAQNKSGFINDSINKEKGIFDGQPIAYHAFILFILTNALTCCKAFACEVEYKNEIEEIIRRGFNWLKNTVTEDGFFAMAGRSRYQVFTWGVFATIICYCTNDSKYLDKVLDCWTDYREDDGSYCCTPNYLNTYFRSGYEGYTRNNMYNCLMLTGMVVADMCINNNYSLGENIDCSDGSFVDDESGYAFWRKGNNFVGIILRCHGMVYMPAMQLFHIRINGKKTIIPEARLIETELMNSLYEGVGLRKNGVVSYPSSHENIEIGFNENQIKMKYSDESFACKKTVTFDKNSIEFKYQVELKQSCDYLFYYFPVLLYDGKNKLIHRAVENNVFELKFSDDNYRITVENSQDSFTSLRRQLCSVSGLTSQIDCIIKEKAEAGESFEFSAKLEVL